MTNNTPNLVSHFKEPKKDRTRTWFRVVIIISILLLIVAGVLGFLFYKTNQQLKNQPVEQGQQKSTEETTADANAKLISEVGKLIVLPKDEQPTIATVSDLSKLQGQAFFAKAQIGDKVLIYNKDKKAILYRPSENKIIELAPLVDGEAQPSPAPASTTPPAQ